MERIVIGHVEIYANETVRGWALDISGQSTAVDLDLYIDGQLAGHCQTSELREDVFAAHPVHMHSGWSFKIPRRYLDGRRLKVSALARDADSRISGNVFRLSQGTVQFWIDTIDSHKLEGWAVRFDDPHERVSIALEVAGEIVSRTIADTPRPDVATAGFGDGKHGWFIKVPLKVTTRGTDEARLLAFTSNGDREVLAQISIPRRSRMRALMVTDLPLEQTDASKYYRILQKRHSYHYFGVDTKVINRESANAFAFDNWDFVILQRTVCTPNLLSAIERYKRFGGVIFYETDDLNIFQSLKSEFGFVLSGITSANDPGLRDLVNNRFTSALLSNAVIVPNRFMARFMRNSGFRTIIDGFKIEDHFVLKERQAPRNERWRILYMSGSPSHVHDLTSVLPSLGRFLFKNRDVDLTVFGKSEPFLFGGWERVRFVDHVPYHEMFQVIDEHDIVIAPFAKNTFNLAKSPTKFMEAGARGVPVIVPMIPAYAAHVFRSGHGYAVPWRRDWYDALQTAYKNRHLDYAKSADLCAYVEREFAVRNTSGAFFDQVVDLSNTISQHASAGGYHRPSS